MNGKLTLKSILWFVAAFGATAAVFRLKSGLGATTAVTDSITWGMWTGLKLGLVALSAGGFVIAGMVYVFHMERFRPILRASVLAAFLGYLTFATLLTLDLGLPWRIWHPMIYWQYHSVLFEVAVCVMAYLGVMALEIGPTVLEHPLFRHPLFQFAYKMLKRLTVPLVILGIMLSTLHQSSLGALFLITPYRTHPLWYSPVIYVNFFVSAVALSFSVAIVLAGILRKIFDFDPRLDMLTSLGRASSFVLIAYMLIRLSDLGSRGLLLAAFDGSWQSTLFLLEIGIGALLPIVLFNVKRVNRNPTGLLVTSLMVIAGIFAYRQDLFLTMSDRQGSLAYVPALAEFAIPAALICGAALVFIFCVENLGILKASADPQQNRKNARSPGVPVWPGNSLHKSFALFSLVVVLGVGAAMAFLPPSALHGFQYPPTPVKDAVGWDTLLIDGNRALESVMFPHEDHKRRLGPTRDSCMTCHHMSRPGDGPSSCYTCHSDMYLEASIFNHKQHQTRLGGNRSCDSCHVGSKSRETVMSCAASDCHPSMFSQDTTIDYIAVSYLDAMHGQCRKCHEDRAGKDSVRTEVGYCSACHPGIEGKPEVVARLPRR